MAPKNRKIPLALQGRQILKYFPNSNIKVKGDHELNWIGEVQPTPASRKYRVSLSFNRKNGLQVFVIEPKPLELAEGKDSLPHVYSNAKQQLCLFFPNSKEWNRSMTFTRTVIPWISEWLYFYELWVGTGEWLGGGTNHSVEKLT